ncbi:ATP-binding cassette subfamily B [Aureococcus anophagefferens]|nr:ATP-binding cassette subfamily B [Aureococcus anophagefferens]
MPRSAEQLFGLCRVVAPLRFFKQFDATATATLCARLVLRPLVAGSRVYLSGECYENALHVVLEGELTQGPWVLKPGDTFGYRADDARDAVGLPHRCVVAARDCLVGVLPVGDAVEVLPATGLCYAPELARALLRSPPPRRSPDDDAVVRSSDLPYSLEHCTRFLATHPTERSGHDVRAFCASLLCHVPFFLGVPRATAERLASRMELLRLDRGEALRLSPEDHYCFVLLSGRLTACDLAVLEEPFYRCCLRGGAAADDAAPLSFGGGARRGGPPPPRPPVGAAPDAVARAVFGLEPCAGVAASRRCGACQCARRRLAAAATLERHGAYANLGPLDRCLAVVVRGTVSVHSAFRADGDDGEPRFAPGPGRLGRGRAAAAGGDAAAADARPGRRRPVAGRRAAAEADRARRAARAPAASARRPSRSVARHAWTTAPRNARLQIVASVACLVAAKALTVSVPFLLQGCVDGLVSRDRAAAVRATALYCGARVAVVLASEARSLTYAHASQQAVRGYARELFGSLHALGPAFHARHPTGLLSVAFSRGARGFQTLLFQLLFSVLPTLVELGLSAAVLGRRFGASVGLGTVATFLAYAAFTARVIDAKVRVKRRLVALDNAKSAYLVDSLGGTETVKLFNGEAVEALRFDDFLRSMVRAFVASSRVNGLLNVGQALIFSAGLGGCLLQATRRPGALTLGDVVAVNALLLQLAQPMNFLGYTASEIRQSLVDMRVTEDILAARRAEDAPRRPRAPTPPPPGRRRRRRGRLRRSARALDGATFFAPPGKTTVLVGASGPASRRRSASSPSS